jgi:hypothetical protein
MPWATSTPPSCGGMIDIVGPIFTAQRQPPKEFIDPSIGGRA